MDQDRAIRFAIPPFFLFASLLWGAHLGGCDLSFIFKLDVAKELLGLLAAAAVAVVPIGFLIGTISVILLRLLAWITGAPTYEAKLSDSTLDRIWRQLGSTHPKDKKLTLYASTTFDHELVDKGIHTWLLRRWNAFHLATHSIVALLLAHLFAPVFSIAQVWTWWVSTAGLIAILFVNALCSWRETMKMIEFQSYRQQKGGAKDEAAGKPPAKAESSI
jgi:hypothetical protein